MISNDRFYNTISLEARELQKAEQQAKSQDQKILQFFIQKGYEYACAPSAVRRRLFCDTVPLTSVRRAMTTLTKNGDLVKLNAKIIGPYGKPEHIWAISGKWKSKVPVPEQQKLL